VDRSPKNRSGPATANRSRLGRPPMVVDVARGGAKPAGPGRESRRRWTAESEPGFRAYQNLSKIPPTIPFPQSQLRSRSPDVAIPTHQRSRERPSASSKRLMSAGHFPFSSARASIVCRSRRPVRLGVFWNIFGTPLLRDGRFQALPTCWTGRGGRCLRPCS